MSGFSRSKHSFCFRVVAFTLVLSLLHFQVFQSFPLWILFEPDAFASHEISSNPADPDDHVLPEIPVPELDQPEDVDLVIPSIADISGIDFLMGSPISRVLSVVTGSEGVSGEARKLGGAAPNLDSEKRLLEGLIRDLDNCRSESKKGTDECKSLEEAIDALRRQIKNASIAGPASSGETGGQENLGSEAAAGSDVLPQSNTQITPSPTPAVSPSPSPSTSPSPSPIPKPSPEDSLAPTSSPSPVPTPVPSDSPSPSPSSSPDGSDKSEGSAEPESSQEVSQDGDVPRDLAEYSFDEARDYLVPDYAAAVIVTELSGDHLRKLVEGAIEVGIAVIGGSIVLFTSGDQDEIRVHPVVRDLLSYASVVAHVHLGSASPTPSVLDLAQAGAEVEYLVGAEGIYAFNQEGVINDAAYEYDFLADRIAEVSSSNESTAGTRNLLNQFIEAIDQYNQDPNHNVLLRASPTILPGQGYLGQWDGSKCPFGGCITLEQKSSSEFRFTYDITRPDTYGGAFIKFDPTVKADRIDRFVFEMVTDNPCTLGACIKIEFKDSSGQALAFFRGRRSAGTQEIVVTHDELAAENLRRFRAGQPTVNLDDLREIVFVIDAEVSFGHYLGFVEIKTGGLHYTKPVSSRPYDGTRLTNLAGPQELWPPELSTNTGSTFGKAQANGIITHDQTSPNNFSWHYDFPPDGDIVDDDFVWTQMGWGYFEDLNDDGRPDEPRKFIGTPQNLSAGYTLAINGPAGKRIKAEGDDVNGLRASFWLELTGEWKNYTLDFASSDHHINFDETQIVQINLVGDIPNLVRRGVFSRSGDISVETRGLQLIPQVAAQDQGPITDLDAIGIGVSAGEMDPHSVITNFRMPNSNQILFHHSLDLNAKPPKDFGGVILVGDIKNPFPIPADGLIFEVLGTPGAIKVSVSDDVQRGSNDDGSPRFRGVSILFTGITATKRFIRITRDDLTKALSTFHPDKVTTLAFVIDPGTFPKDAQGKPIVTSGDVTINTKNVLLIPERPAQDQGPITDLDAIGIGVSAGEMDPHSVISDFRVDNFRLPDSSEITFSHLLDLKAEPPKDFGGVILIGDVNKPFAIPDEGLIFEVRGTPGALKVSVSDDVPSGRFNEDGTPQYKSVSILFTGITSTNRFIKITRDDLGKARSSFHPDKITSLSFVIDPSTFPKDAEGKPIVTSGTVKVFTIHVVVIPEIRPGNQAAAVVQLPAVFPGEFESTEQKGTVKTAEVEIQPISISQLEVAYTGRNKRSFGGTVFVYGKKIGLVPGDANRDGKFGTGDLVAVFGVGKYETGELATWEEGDFNGDGKFDSGDLVTVFSEGGYEKEPPARESIDLTRLFPRGLTFKVSSDTLKKVRFEIKDAFDRAFKADLIGLTNRPQVYQIDFNSIDLRDALRNIDLRNVIEIVFAIAGETNEGQEHKLNIDWGEWLIEQRVTPQDYNADLITDLPGTPVVAGNAGSTLAGKENVHGIIGTLTLSPDEFSYGYELPNDEPAETAKDDDLEPGPDDEINDDFVWGELSWGFFKPNGAFFRDAQDLGDSVTFAVEGLEGTDLTGKELKVEVFDADRNKAVFIFELVNGKHNYTMNLNTATNDKLPRKFNPDRIAQILFVSDVERMGEVGVLRIEAHGIRYVVPVDGTRYDPNVLTQLTNTPDYFVRTSSIFGRAGAHGTIIRQQTSADEFSYTYRFPNEPEIDVDAGGDDDDTAGLADEINDDFVWGELSWGYIDKKGDFIGKPQDLRTGYTFAVDVPQGCPQGCVLRAEVVDAQGDRAYFDLKPTEGLGPLQNYTLNLADAKLPAVFDESKVGQIILVADVPKMGNSGEVRAETRGLKFTPVIGPTDGLTPDKISRVPGILHLVSFGSAGENPLSQVNMRQTSPTTFDLIYNFVERDSFGGSISSFDDFSKPETKETFDLSGYLAGKPLILGLQDAGKPAEVILQLESLNPDPNAKEDEKILKRQVILTGVDATERFYQIDTALFAGADLTKVTAMVLVVEERSVTEPGRSSTLKVRLGDHPQIIEYGVINPDPSKDRLDVTILDGILRLRPFASLEPNEGRLDIANVLSGSRFDLSYDVTKKNSFAGIFSGFDNPITDDVIETKDLSSFDANNLFVIGLKGPEGTNVSFQINDARFDQNDPAQKFSGRVLLQGIGPKEQFYAIDLSLFDNPTNPNDVDLTRVKDIVLVLEYRQQEEKARTGILEVRFGHQPQPVSLGPDAGFDQNSGQLLPAFDSIYAAGSGSRTARVISNGEAELTFDVSAPSSSAAVVFDYDNRATPGAEYQDLSSFAQLVFGTMGTGTSVQYEVLDAAGRVERGFLKELSATPRFYQLSLDDLGVDTKRIRSIRLFVQGQNVDPKQGTLHFWLRGVSVPEAVRQAAIADQLQYFRPGVGVDSITHLPFDDVKASGSPERSTQLTAIGFYLQILGEVSRGLLRNGMSRFEALREIQRVLATLTGLQSDPATARNGLLYNRYSLTVPIRPWSDPLTESYALIAFGDNANLSQSLAVLISTLEPLQQGLPANEGLLVSSVIRAGESFLDKQRPGYTEFYDAGRGQFHASYDTRPETRGFTNFWIDRLANEFRSGVAFVISRYEPTPNAWLRAWDNLLVRTKTYTDQSRNQVANLAPWDGGAFQVFWPLLWSNEQNQPKMQAALQNFLYTAFDFSHQNRIPGFVSASGFPEGGYVGRAGIPVVRERQEPVVSNVGSIYALASAYVLNPNLVLAWLGAIREQYQDLGRVEEVGFVDSLRSGTEFTETAFAIDQGSTILGLLGTGGAAMDAYLQSRGRLAKYNSLYDRLNLGITRTTLTPSGPPAQFPERSFAVLNNVEIERNIGSTPCVNFNCVGDTNVFGTLIRYTNDNSGLGGHLWKLDENYDARGLNSELLISYSGASLPTQFIIQVNDADDNEIFRHLIETRQTGGVVTYRIPISDLIEEDRAGDRAIDIRQLGSVRYVNLVVNPSQAGRTAEFTIHEITFRKFAREELAAPARAVAAYAAYIPREALASVHAVEAPVGSLIPVFVPALEAAEGEGELPVLVPSSSRSRTDFSFLNFNVLNLEAQGKLAFASVSLEEDPSFEDLIFGFKSNRALEKVKVELEGQGGRKTSAYVTRVGPTAQFYEHLDKSFPVDSDLSGIRRIDVIIDTTELKTGETLEDLALEMAVS